MCNNTCQVWTSSRYSTYQRLHSGKVFLSVFIQLTKRCLRKVIGQASLLMTSCWQLWLKLKVCWTLAAVIRVSGGSWWTLDTVTLAVWQENFELARTTFVVNWKKIPMLNVTFSQEDLFMLTRLWIGSGSVGKGSTSLYWENPIATIEVVLILLQCQSVMLHSADRPRGFWKIGQV